MKQTIERLFCDFCEKEIKGLPSERATIQMKDCCPTCLTSIRMEVELEYQRVINGQVPDRRGGFRTLGDFADT